MLGSMLGPPYVILTLIASETVSNMCYPDMNKKHPVEMLHSGLKMEGIRKTVGFGANGWTMRRK